MSDKEQLILAPPAHRNQHLFSDHYLNEIIKEHPYWKNLISNAQEIIGQIAEEFKKFVPSENERQTEENLVMPILKILGHTFEVQPSLKTPENIKTPDYVFYKNAEARDKNKNQVLTEELPNQGGIAIGDAKYWMRPLDVVIKQKGGDALSNKNPSYQIYFYMLHSGVTWGILTNGKLWRLYHKDTAHKLDHFYEVDLEELVKSGDVERFLYFYVFFRREAFDDSPLSVATILRESADYAHNVGNSLKDQVYDALRHIAQGFLDYTPNKLNSDPDTLKDIYNNSLILLYRLIFILYAEARELLPLKENQQYKDIYSLYAIKHSVAQDLDKGKNLLPNSTRLWPQLKDLFNIINLGSPPLKVATFNGGLFDPKKHKFLDDYTVGDGHLQQAIDKLARVNKEFVDYRDLSVRHMGTIYEGLLEYILRPLQTPDNDWLITLINDKGERKVTGSYYTPDDIVKHIVEKTVGPVLKRAIDGKENDADKMEGVLNVNVLDPAMGSGHFLVEATEYIARFLVDLAIVPKGKAQEEADLAYWKRRVVQSCIYGVDLNPLAVELAKLSLWLTTVAKDKPLSFLDHHLRPGNSLVGARLEHLAINTTKKSNGRKKTEEAQAAGQITLFADSDFTQKIKNAVGSMWLIEENEASDVKDVKEQERLYEELRSRLTGKYTSMLNLVTAAQFGLKIDNWMHSSLIKYLTQNNGTKVPQFEAFLSEADKISEQERFFHWELEFPEIYFDQHGRPMGNEGGFDAVVGNPPWERIKLQENEFFAGRDSDIALAPRAADRKRLIESLQKKKPELWHEYEIARDRAERLLVYTHDARYYPLMGRGDTNYYAIFAERALQLMANKGRVGLLVPSGIATDDTTKFYFQHLIKNRMLAELLDFENRDAIFHDVHRSFKFSIILITGESLPQESIRCGFFLHNMLEIEKPERICMLSPKDFKVFNPNTLTCPIFRRSRDFELTRKIYKHAPVLINRELGEKGNPWGISFQRMFDMTNDSKLFKTAKELEAEGYWLGEGNVFTKGVTTYLPLYEGKMVQMYDHRAANIVVNQANLHRPAQEVVITPKEHLDHRLSAIPQFWVPTREVLKRLDNPDLAWLLGFKSVTAPTNIRSFICMPIPLVGVGNSMPIFRFEDSNARALLSCFIANLSCFVIDFAARQKIGGQNLNFFVVEQFPVLPLQAYGSMWHGVNLADFIKERVLELCYTAYDMKGFAKDMGYDGPPFVWDEERRLHLKCQLDALYFHLYKLTKDEAGEILDTFPIVKRQDEAKFGTFRTKDLILAYYNAYKAGNMDAWVKG